MRVTQSMISENFMRNLNTNLRRLADKNDMMASKKKIRRPSDDPVGAAMALKLRRQLTAIEQYNSNAQDALTWMKNSESALTNTGNIMHRLKELTIEAANGTRTLDDREKTLHEVSELKEQIFQEANSTNVDRYLFSGYKTNVPPFVKDADGKIVTNPELLEPNGVNILSDSGTGINAQEQIDIDGLGANIIAGKYRLIVSDHNVVTGQANIEIFKINDDSSTTSLASGSVAINGDNQLVGSDAENQFTFNFGTVPITGDGNVEFELTSLLPDGTMEYNLGKSESIPVNIIGPEVFEDIFKTVEAIEEALDTNNTDALSEELLKDIQDGTGAVLKYRSQIGARTNRLEATIARLDINSVDYEEVLSKTVSLNWEKAITELKMDECVYRMSLAVGARIIQPNLTDFLR